ncbi:hypothetical protein AB6A40_011302 [Gnathostoma spinigerum]|uniref:Uncharacterized protein n=1 Tax=Gnathostoma spinigerum TaxID=75299 RepID=A0ABD6EX98_9BILA
MIAKHSLLIPWMFILSSTIAQDQSSTQEISKFLGNFVFPNSITNPVFHSEEATKLSHPITFQGHPPSSSTLFPSLFPAAPHFLQFPVPTPSFVSTSGQRF